MPDEDGVITWERDVGLLTNRFIAWDLLKVSILSPAVMFVSVALMGMLVDGELIALPWYVFFVAFGALFALLAVSCLLLGNRMRLWFGVGPAGAAWQSGLRERTLNRGVTVIGALAASPGTAGAGLLATANESGAIEWREVHRAVYHPASHVITLRNSWRTVVRLYATAENWESVRAMVEAGVAAGAAWRTAPDAPKPASILGYAAWIVVAAVGGALSAAWTFRPEESALWIALATVFVAISRFGEGIARRLFALFGLASLLPLAFLYAAEAFSTFDSIFGGKSPLWTLDTEWLAVATGGQALLAGMALWNMLAPGRPAEGEDDGQNGEAAESA